MRYRLLTDVSAVNLLGIANALRRGGFEKGELATYADMLEAMAGAVARHAGREAGRIAADSRASRGPFDDASGFSRIE